MILTQQQKDILLAGAIGDAVGYVIEFSKLDKIHRDYGPTGLTLDMIQPTAILTVSDDTQMTLFALEAIHAKGDETRPNDYYEAFMQWYLTQTDFVSPLITSHIAKLPSMQHQRAPGMTCLSALAKALPRPMPINDSKGCGGIMRAAPCGFLDNIEDAFMQGLQQARVTHGHPSGYLSAAFFSALIHAIGRWGGTTLSRPIELTLGYLDGHIGNDETFDIIEKAQRIALQSQGDIYSDIKRIGEGWVGEEALGIAIYSVYVAKTFEEVIQISINHSGDSDSTGTLAAQLWVALYGLPEKYREWEKRLDIADAFAYATNGDNYK
jgi:ADP-ribosylglycohydrolase